MFKIMTIFANWATVKLGLDLSSRAGSAVSFFIEDTIKIFFLIYVMLFVVSLFRSQTSPERIKEYLSGKTSVWGYFLAVVLGTVTPFCSCSSIPLFLGFVAAGIPFGITMTFLIASPLISEVAAAMLITMPEAGLKVATVYVLIGAIISVIGGFLCDYFKLDKYIIKDEKPSHCGCSGKKEEYSKFKSTVKYAFDYSNETTKEIWLYVIAGLAIGAYMHGFVPSEFFIKYLGAKNIFAVPLAAVVGIPLYANHNGVLPIVQVLLMKGVPVGTTLTMLMSITAISLPEMIMLHKVLSWKMLFIFATYLLVAFTFVGYLLNWIM